MDEKKKRRHIEREFGVPVAGEILDPSRWTNTALKKLPADGLIDLAGLFGRSAPLVLDLGCGNGRWLIGSAVWRPQFDHLGVDILPVVIRYATRAGTDQFKRVQKLRHVLAGLLEKLPDDLKNSPEVKLLRSAVDRKVHNIVHLIYRARHYEGHSK